MSFEIENGVLIKYYEEPGVTDVVIPDGVTSIGDRAFYMRWSLTSIIIPEGVKEIGNEAFSCCEKIISITIPDSVRSIGCCAFALCGSLTNIAIPNGVTCIGNNAFGGCISLASVTIPDEIVERMIRCTFWHFVKAHQIRVFTCFLTPRGVQRAIFSCWQRGHGSRSEAWCAQTEWACTRT